MCEFTPNAAKQNSTIFKKFDYDFSKIISPYPDSDLSYGSEFRPVSILEPLLHNHRSWINFSKYCTFGFDASFSPLSDKQRLQDVQAAISRGNHKSAERHIEVLRNNFVKEIKTGFQFPFLIEDIPKIKGSMVAPVGVASQETVNELGEIVPKYRPTHDQSFEFSPGTSVNKLLLKDDLPPLFYGFCLLRILHYIHALRLSDSTCPILISKVDFKSAYRRGTISSALAARSITILCGYALFLRCLPFGDSHCLNLWCVVSEFVTDLTNDLLTCADWDENTLFSPHVHKLSPPALLSDDIPFHQAKPADVKVHVSCEGRAGVFIDDIVTVGYLSAQWKRLCGAALLAIHIFGRPVDSAEPVPRDDLLSLNKLLSEGSPSEVQTVLGWNINTRTFCISLPSDKFSEWTAQINTILDLNFVLPKDLESLIGRLNHAAFVIPLSRHYLNRLRNLHSRLKHHKHIHLTKEVVLDLQLWLHFLHRAHEGISINLIIERQPDCIFVTESCEYGLGGFSMKTGKAFRYEIPYYLRFRVSNNVLEYLAEVIAVWLGVLDGEVQDESCVFSGTDNTSAVGWTCKSNFSDSSQKLHITIS